MSNIIPPVPDLSNAYARYFGALPAGINVVQVIQSLDTVKLEGLKRCIEQVKASSTGRVFVCGNGGSFDNALSFVALLQGCQVRAKVPGEPSRYFHGRYDDIFVTGLQEDLLTKNDLVIGLSGSGNSPNVLNALTYAQNIGATIYALGGRDGGKMRALVGDAHTVLAATESMEAIEDAHYAVGIMLAEVMKSGDAFSAVQERVIASLRATFFNGPQAQKNLELCGNIGEGVLRAMVKDAPVFILGDGIASRHVRADAGRGFTNTIPLRGLYAPELFTINSGMATCNDDGSAYLLADGLAKVPHSPDAFALLLYTTESAERVLAPCLEILEETRASAVLVGAMSGERVIDISPWSHSFDAEFIVTLIGHATGTVIREILTQAFSVRLLGQTKHMIDFKGERKLSLRDTLQAEERLRQAGIIQADEVITFAYGKVFAARDPELFGLSRGHY
jgi:D-sedoheptulose 7-phosphate isomerase